MLQKLPITGFECVEIICEFHESFIKSYNEEKEEGYFLEVDVQYHEKMHDHQNGLPFLTERMKIENVEKLVTSLHDKTEYVIHIKKNLKQALNHGFVMKKFHRVITFNEKAWLKTYINMNSKLRKKNKK